jgi:hypothetical protein
MHESILLDARLILDLRLTQIVVSHLGHLIAVEEGCALIFSKVVIFVILFSNLG